MGELIQVSLDTDSFDDEELRLISSLIKTNNLNRCATLSLKNSFAAYKDREEQTSENNFETEIRDKLSSIEDVFKDNILQKLFVIEEKLGSVTFSQPTLASKTPIQQTTEVSEIDIIGKPKVTPKSNSSKAKLDKLKRLKKG